MAAVTSCSDFGAPKNKATVSTASASICHEYDHLEGILFVDKVLPGTLEYVKPEK